MKIFKKFTSLLGILSIIFNYLNYKNIAIILLILTIISLVLNIKDQDYFIKKWMFVSFICVVIILGFLLKGY